MCFTFFVGQTAKYVHKPSEEPDIQHLLCVKKNNNKRSTTVGTYHVITMLDRPQDFVSFQVDLKTEINVKHSSNSIFCFMAQKSLKNELVKRKVYIV